MFNKTLHSMLENLAEVETPAGEDLVTLLQLQEPEDLHTLFAFADAVRRRAIGDGILLRGLVEFSNHCRKTCHYCGLRPENISLERYRLTREEILDCASHIAALGIQTMVLQSGEDPALEVEWLGEIIQTLKGHYGLIVTLSVGERSVEDYRVWKEAGADRYLLKIETSDARLYAAHHPGMSLERRLTCIQALQKLGYQTGSGCIVGLKGQRIDHLVHDLLFLKKNRFDMVSISVFVPHPRTPLGNQPSGDLTMTYKMIALARILSRDAHMPVPTALTTLGGNPARVAALQAGANVLMPNFSPACRRPLYDIYPNTQRSCTTAAQAVREIRNLCPTLGRFIDESPGHSLKHQASQAPYGDAYPSSTGYCVIGRR